MSGVSWPWIRFFQLLHDVIFGTSGVAGSGIVTALVTAFAPVVTAGSGAFTTVSATSRYKQIGKMIFIQLVIVITANGTAGTRVNATLPFVSANTAGSQVISGKATAVSGKALTGVILPNSNQILIVNYDNSYPGANGETLVLQGWYEAA
jgi:hypothetical protein